MLLSLTAYVSLFVGSLPLTIQYCYLLVTERGCRMKNDDCGNCNNYKIITVFPVAMVTNAADSTARGDLMIQPIFMNIPSLTFTENIFLVGFEISEQRGVENYIVSREATLA